MEILYEDNHIIVIVKEPNIPAQRDNSNNLDLLSMIKTYLKEKYHKPGNAYVGLIHRLDRPVGGLMVFAKTSKAASRLNKMMQEGKFTKKYYALVHGRLKQENGVLENYLQKDEKTNTSRVVNDNVKNSKKARLEYQLISFDLHKGLSLLDINLLTGRHHQIRVQFSYINHPIYGDQRYGNMMEKGIQIHLWAYFLSFKHPIRDEIMTFEYQPPWNK